MRMLFLLLAVVFLAGCSPKEDAAEPAPSGLEDKRHEPGMAAQTETQVLEVINMKISSPAFKDGKAVPSEYSCQGENVNPELEISGVPDEAASLVLIIDDPDAPAGIWDHWVVFNIPPDTENIAKDSVPGTQAKNSWGKNAYGGPCPPSGKHRYNFRLYALDIELDLDSGAARQDIDNKMEGHVLAEAGLTGTYEKV